MKIVLIVIAVGFKQLHSHSKIKVFFTTGDHQSPQLIYGFPEFKYTLPFSVHNHFDEWTWLLMKFVRKYTRSFTVYCCLLYTSPSPRDA